MREQRLVVESQYGYELSCTVTLLATDLRSTAGVLLLHGFGTGKDNRLNRELAPRLAELGIASCRFDFAGHGGSGGDTASLTVRSAADDAVRVASHCRSQFLTPDARFGIVASSFGASAALRGLKELSPSALVLRAPISDYAEVRRLQFGEDGIARWKTTGLIEVESSKGPVLSGYGFYEDASSHDTYAAVQGSQVPTLILHGDLDDNVPLAQSQKLCMAIGSTSRLVVMQGAGHSFSEPSHFERLTAECVSFLRAKLLGRANALG